MLHKAQAGEERLGILCQKSPRGGDLRVVVQSTEGDGRVPERRHLLRAMAGANLAVVFLKGHIADPMQPILDAPVAAHQRRQLCRVSAGAGQRGDAVDRLARRCPDASLGVARGTFAHEAKGLLNGGPAQRGQMLIEGRRGDDGPSLATAVALVALGVRRPFSSPLPLLSGGT